MADIQDSGKYYIEREDGLFFTQRGKFVDDLNRAVKFISRDTALDCRVEIRLRYGRKFQYKVKPNDVQENDRSRRQTKPKQDQPTAEARSQVYKTSDHKRSGKFSRRLSKKGNQLDLFGN